MEIDLELDIVDDDLEAIDLINYGIPRQIYERSNYFYSMDELNFFKRFRLTKDSVLNLLAKIEHELEFPYDLNNCVSPTNQLLVCLRYYATGNHLLSIADFGGIHTSTVSRIIVRVSEAIARLYDQYIKMPSTAQEIAENQNRFYDIAAFPRIIGTLDCTHIKIQSPGGDDPEIFRNRKGYFSFNVQAISDAKLKILNLVARWPGSVHDATIFNNSTVKAQIENGMYGNGLLLGDSGYPLTNYLMTPFLNPATPAEQLYNESHIRTRNTVERLFGVLKRRFPVLAYGCRLKLDTTMTIIVATSVLHNIAVEAGEGDPPVLDDIDENNLQNLIHQGQIPALPNQMLHGNIRGVHVRNNLVQTYFANM